MWSISNWTLNDTISFYICIWTLLNEGTNFLIFTSLHSLVDLYFQRTRFELGMYEISCYLDVRPNTYCWIEIFMQGNYCTCIYPFKLGSMLNIVYKDTNVFLIWSSTWRWGLAVPNVWMQNGVHKWSMFKWAQPLKLRLVGKRVLQSFRFVKTKL
jgi:hypothetical protein